MALLRRFDRVDLVRVESLNPLPAQKTSQFGGERVGQFAKLGRPFWQHLDVLQLT